MDYTSKEEDGTLSLSKLEPVQKDVLMSFSASGEISKTCSELVRPGGFLVANDDFGDACLAKGSPDVWQLIGVFNNDNLETEPEILETYFVAKGDVAKNSGFSYSKRPFKCTKRAEAYLFQKKF